MIILIITITIKTIKRENNDNNDLIKIIIMKYVTKIPIISDAANSSVDIRRWVGRLNAAEEALPNQKLLKNLEHKYSIKYLRNDKDYL